MDYIVGQKQFTLEMINLHAQYFQKKLAEKFRTNVVQVDKHIDESSHMGESMDRRAYTSYSPQDKSGFFKLKIEKCMSASAAAKQWGNPRSRSPEMS